MRSYTASGSEVGEGLLLYSDSSTGTVGFAESRVSLGSRFGGGWTEAVGRDGDLPAVIPLISKSSYSIPPPCSPSFPPGISS